MAPQNDIFPVMESFLTIQGEGKHQGHAAYFIRLGGCDVGCIWCDVKESWDAEVHPKRSLTELVQEAVQSGVRLVVLTGGEPLMYDLTRLISALQAEGIEVHIETSGAYPLRGTPDWVCFSPKRFKKPLPELLDKADELKVIIFANSDFRWAEEFAQKVRPGCVLSLQPEWDKSEKMLPRIIEYVKTHPQWRVSLQTHKFMAIP